MHPDSAEYKKARSQFIKTTRKRPQVEGDWTPFRAAEKKFKARFPPPDLSGVLDLAAGDEKRKVEVRLGEWAGKSDAIECKVAGRDAVIVPSIPGTLEHVSSCDSEVKKHRVRVGYSSFIRLRGPTTAARAMGSG
jgi:alkylated DNA repair protein alkB family protein 1